MMYGAILAPLRAYLRWVVGPGSPEAEHPCEERGLLHVHARYRDSLLVTLAVVGGGLLFIVVLFVVALRPVIELLSPCIWRLFSRVGDGADFWGMPSDVNEARAFLERFCRYLMCTCSNIYLVMVCPLVCKRPSMTTWLVILNTYVHKLFFYRAQDDRFFHGFDLMTIGLCCYYLGLRMRRQIGVYVIRYWFVVMLACGLLWPPGVHDRFDENPPREVDTRVRVNLLELIFIVLWLAAGERLVQPEIFTEDKMDFLNNWALLLFLVHKAVHMTIVPPLNWATLLLLAPACHLMQHRHAYGDCCGMSSKRQ
mmetsp:Transcript_18627/g.54087  ORF Transcript_18627/g.54087 Transcript_18627/m.54087 type:complete len:310 (-) Transcript_18627:26-955(-)